MGKKEEYLSILVLTQSPLPQYCTIRKVVYEVKIGNELFSFELFHDLGAEEKDRVKIKVERGFLIDKYSIVYKRREAPATLIPNIYSTLEKNK